MFTWNSWPEHMPNVTPYKASPRPQRVEFLGLTIAWVRAFTEDSDVTPTIANDAFANCAEVATNYGITLPDYCEAGLDHMGRTILLASNVEGQRVDPSLRSHIVAAQRISEFYQAYRNDPLWQQASIGDLLYERNYHLDTEGRVRIVDIGDIFPPA